MPDEPGDDPAATARVVADLGRDGYTRILATLARRFGDLDLAEDALQDAVAEAMRTWPATGVPVSPAAWLTTTAKRKALDVIRRDSVLARKLATLRIQEERTVAPAIAQDPAEHLPDPDPFCDDLLSLYFACAHPGLRPEDRVAMTLRFVAGLSTPEVAHALLVPVPTMQQRITRAKQRIHTLGVPFGPPPQEEFGGRVDGVLRVIYLLFTEGFARSTGQVHVRDDLTSEAILLARRLRRLLPNAETTGLLALLLLTQSRRPARTGPDGRPVPLSRQDRTLWDSALRDEGTALAESAAADDGAGSYAIQASIAALHAEARTFEETDWPQIALLYSLLEAREPGPVVRLARVVALGRAVGLAEGLRLLDELADDPALARLRGFHIARAVTLEELGRADEAGQAYRRALELPGNDAEDDYLRDALADLEG